MFAASTILYKMIVCLSESRGGSSFGESIFSYCGQRYSTYGPAIPVHRSNQLSYRGQLLSCKPVTAIVHELTVTAQQQFISE